MLKKFIDSYRQTTLIEKLLGVVGVFIILSALWFFDKIYLKESLIDFNLIQTMLLFGILFFLVIQVDASERMKDELAVIMSANKEEVKLLKEEVVQLKEETVAVKEETSMLRQIEGKQLEQMKQYKRVGRQKTK